MEKAELILADLRFYLGASYSSTIRNYEDGTTYIEWFHDDSSYAWEIGKPTDGLPSYFKKIVSSYE